MLHPHKATVEVCFIEGSSVKSDAHALWAKHFPRQSLEVSPIYINGDIMNYFIVAYGAEVEGMMNLTASKLLKHFPSLEFNGNFLIYRAFYDGPKEEAFFVDMDVSPTEFVRLVKAHFK